MGKSINYRILSLLRVIETNNSIDSLLNEDLSLVEISSMTNNLITAGFAIFSENRVALTDKGRGLLAKLTELRSKDKELWIKPQSSQEIDTIDPKYIYLLNRHELFF